MRPKVALVSGFSSWSGYLGNILRKVFSDEIEVIEYNSDRNLIHEPVVADLILITQVITYYSGYRFFNPSTPTINLSMTFTKQQCALLRSIPAGTKVLIVNDEEQATAETISAFQRLGLTHSAKTFTIASALFLWNFRHCATVQMIFFFCSATLNA